MKPCATTVHVIQMLDYAHRIRQIAAAIRELVVEPFPDELSVFLIVDLEGPALADAPAQFVKKHTGQFVRNVRLGPPRGGA